MKGFASVDFFLWIDPLFAEDLKMRAESKVPLINSCGAGLFLYTRYENWTFFAGWVVNYLYFITTGTPQ